MKYQLDKIPTTTVIEYVRFSTKSGITHQEVLLACKDTDPVLATIDGYIHRFVALQDDDTWVEVVFWKSLEQAKRGLDLFLKHPLSKNFLDKIQEGSVKIEYATIA